MSGFDQLFQPISLGPTRIRNRLFNPPHATGLGHGSDVNDDLIAYHTTRAKGGVGLIILEGMTVHPSYGFPDAFLYAGDDAIIPGMARLANATHAHDTPIIGQLFHAGRAVRLSYDGSRPVVYSASGVPDDRYRVVPAPMPNALVWEIIESYAAAAGRLAEAGLDGVEILGSMGYLIAQFLNPQTNLREDEFGGSFDNRMRFVREIVTRSRAAIGAEKTLGIRVTLNEQTDTGLTPQLMLEVCGMLDADGHLDYFNVIAGSSATPGGWVHVFPPMAIPQGYVASDAARLKAAVSKPVLVAGRINQPQMAESILQSGHADMIGMVRPLIADPELPNKTRTGNLDDIRACVACNQACVGHRLAHHKISCIQHPVTGREREFANVQPATKRKTVWVAGGGPAGLKAAITSAGRGHKVTLFEQSAQLGGQIRLAQALPRREEFGGVLSHLQSELERADVDVKLNTKITAADVRTRAPHVLFVATGATPSPMHGEIDGAHVLNAWSVVSGAGKPGNRVVIADWSCDWNGLGVAELLARNGHHVRLYSGGIVAGESIQAIVRDQWIGELHKLGVEMIPYARFYGADDTTAWFTHTMSGEAIVCDGVDTIVSCDGPQRNYQLADELADWEGELHVIGDAIAPRTVEEAVLEGFRTSTLI
ncbi:MAG: FAD-dependent oxidoreductase [Pseudomonadota bacterium]